MKTPPNNYKISQIPIMNTPSTLNIQDRRQNMNVNPLQNIPHNLNHNQNLQNYNNPMNI